MDRSSRRYLPQVTDVWGLPSISDVGSQRIRIARVLCIFFVIYAHIYVGTDSIITGRLDAANFAVAVNAILFDGLARISVPLLGLISGYLAVDSYLNSRYFRLIQRKLYSLILPMAVWSLLLILLYYAAGIASGDFQFITNNLPSSALDWCNALFSITASPFNGPMHFVRDIFICFLLLPVFFVLVRWLPGLTSFVAFFIFISEGTFFLFEENILPIFFRPSLPALFFIGLVIRTGYLQHIYCPINQLIFRSVWIIGLLISVLVIYARAAGFGSIAYGSEKILVTVRILGILFVWGLSLRLSETVIGGRLSRLDRFAFFAFASHSLTLFVLFQVIGLLYLWKIPDSVNYFYFFTAPIFCFWIAAVGQIWVERLFPTFGRLLRGRLPIPSDSAVGKRLLKQE